MPKVSADDVPHTSQTNHSVPRIPMEGQPSPLDGLVKIFREDSGVIPDAELDRIRAIFMVKQAEITDNPYLALDAVETLESWIEVAPDDIRAIEALGAALMMGKENTAAVTVWERGLLQDPDNENLLRRLVFTYQDSGQNELALAYGRRLVDANPWDHEYWGRLAHLLGQNGEFEAGIEAAKHSLDIRPSNALMHGWLVEVYEQIGDAEQAAEHRRMFAYLTTGN
jgi:tetratricopeptide (TPR) repeat protein